MTAPSPSVRDLVYGSFRTLGRAPSVAELARLTGGPPEAVQRVLRELADVRALVLNADGDAVRMAHPFSAAPMAFVVTPQDGRDDRRWWGGCAWDSFGISAALELDVRIDTACPYCGRHLGYAAGPDTPPPAPLAVRFPRPARRWWDDVVATCTMIRTFCDRDHAERWEVEHAAVDGYLTDATTVWRLARPWYGDRLRADFTPHTRQYNQQILDDCGLTGPFWELPGPGG